MDNALSKDFRFQLYEFFTKKAVYHTAFWALVFLLLVVWESLTSKNDFGFVLTNNLIRLIIFCVIVYFNVYYLIPNYLTKKKFVPYLGFLVLSIFIVTPLESLIFYLKFKDFPALQNQIVTNLNWSFLRHFAKLWKMSL